MIDFEAMDDLKAELAEKSKNKITLMKSSRDLVKTSKVLIYALLRGDIADSDIKLEKIKSQKNDLIQLAQSSKLTHYGPFGNAMQEYVEAVAFSSFIKDGIIPSHKELGVDAETYVMGLSDLTGEMMRKAVNDMVKDNFESAVQIKEIVEKIYGVILDLDLDGGEARRKSDQIKWNLQKIEGLVFEAKIRDKL